MVKGVGKRGKVEQEGKRGVRWEKERNEVEFQINREKETKEGKTQKYKGTVPADWWGEVQ